MLMLDDTVNKAGDSNQQEGAAEVNSFQTLQDFKVATTLYGNIAKNALDIKGTAQDILNQGLSQLTDLLSFEKNLERLKALDSESAKINQALGTGAKKSDEFRKLIADAGAKYAEFGISMDQVGKDYIALSTLFGTNISISDENLADLAATSKVSGIAMGELAAGFTNIGGILANIPDKMMTVTKVAKESGVMVKAVSDKVVDNLNKMNLYNFEGGTKGLAKMAAQATKLGIDMGKVFAFTEKVFNPDGAIETAAALQRLGVSTSALLDPLKLMDLSANDPTELQNQIVSMTKDFVRFNKDLGEFEILPGEKRRLREIAEAMDMSTDELVKMGTAAANLDMKMKQIKFSPGTSKEDREMIATLAQINKDGIAEVKVKKLDEKTGEWTGEYEMKAVDQLKPKDIENLQESQELQGKTMEQLAVDQLGELEALNAKIAAFKTGLEFGVTTMQPMQNLYSMGTTGVRKQLIEEEKGDGGLIKRTMRETENWRNAYSNLGDEVINFGKKVKEEVTSIKDLGDAADLAKKAFDKLTEIAKDPTVLTTNLTNIMGKSFNEPNTSYSGGLGLNSSNAKKVNNNEIQNATLNTSNSSSNTSNSNLNVSNQSSQSNSSNVSLNNSIDINVKLDDAAKDQALKNILNEAVQKYFEDPSKMSWFIDKELEVLKNRYNIIPKESQKGSFALY